MKSINLNILATLMDEIDRAYRVLGTQARMQNHLDIVNWLISGIINTEQYKTLLEYNRKQSSNY